MAARVEASPTQSRTATLLGVTLGLWAVGVQVNELLATVGAWGTFLATALLVWQQRAQPWWPALIPRGVARALALFLGLALALPLLAGFTPSGTGFARLADWLLLPAAAVAVARLPARALGRIGAAAAVTALVSTALAGLQHVGAWPAREAFAPLAWTRLHFERVYETVPGRDDRFMGAGLLFHRLKYANVTAVFCVLAAAAALLLPEARRRLRLLLGGAALVGLVGVALFPHARAATVALVAALAVTWVLAARNRTRALLGAGALVVAVALAVLVVPSLRTRFASSLTTEGSGDRAGLTAAGLNAVAQHPLTGVGLGRFRPGLYADPGASAAVLEHQGKAHDQFVTLAAEAGAPSALALLAFLALLAAALWRSRPAGIAGLGVLTLFVLLCLLHDPLFHAESSLALMLALGGTLGLTRRQAP